MTSWHQHKLKQASDLEGASISELRINDRHVLYAVGDVKESDLALIGKAVNAALATQAKMLDPAFLAKVAKATDENERTKALILIADRAGLNEIKSQLAFIDRQHRKVGHLPAELYTKRTKLTDDMLSMFDDSVVAELRGKI